MNERLQQQVQMLLETITMNIGYPVSLGDLSLLSEETFYLDICSIIFPEMRDKINKIAEHEAINSVQKIQKLLQVLTQGLQINLIVLPSNQILNGNLLYIYNLLIILKQFSELPPIQASPPKNKFRQRLHSCPSLLSQEINTKQPNSARVYHRERTLQDSKKQQNLQNELFQNFKNSNQDEVKESYIQKKQPEQIQKVEPSCILKQNKHKKNKVYNKINKVFTQKKLIKKFTTSKCQNKKNKKQKPYIQIYMKNSKSKKKKQTDQVRSKSARKSNWVKEVKQIDHFFQTFQNKIRDQKIKYLRHMQRLIRDQQNDRLRLQQRMRIDRAKTVQEHQKKMLGNLMSMHKAKLQILNQRSQSNKQTIKLIKKHTNKVRNDAKKQIKQNRKKQLQQIRNYLAQLNNKVFIKLQQSGQMQKMVQQLYKKF